MGLLDTLAALRSAGGTIANNVGTDAVSSLGNGALSNTAASASTSGQITPQDMGTLMSGLNGALAGQSAMTNALDEFEKQDKMIQQMGKAKKSAVDDAAIL